MTQHPLVPDFLMGGGKLGDLIASLDWTQTPLGRIETWPVSLKTTVGLILRSPVPIVTLWGDQGTMIYNDAYSGFAGGRHPRLLGSPVREGWPEVAAFNDNVMNVGLAGGTLSYTDQELTLYRTGAPEQVWMNLDYSPVIGEDGSPVGVIAIVVETTERVLAERALKTNENRLAFLDRLNVEIGRTTDADEILAITTRMVGMHMGVTNCAYADMDPDQDGFTIRGDWAAPDCMSIRGHYHLADFGALAVHHLSAGQPLVVNDNLKELAPHEAETFQRIGIGATICMPLVKMDRLTALMAVHHQHAHDWTASELALIREVTERSWAHIERVRSEADARESERRFRDELARQVEDRTAAYQQSEKTIRTIFETSYLLQGLLSCDGSIVYANAASLQLMRADLEEVVGTPFWESAWFTETPGMPERIRDVVTRVAKGEAVEMPMSVIIEGERRVYDFSMRPALDKEGQVFGLVPQAADVTARVRAEQALSQSQKLEAIGNLTGGIAHDFNNLLMAVQGSLELLRKRIPQEHALLRFVDNAAEGVRRGQSLTDRMLAFARKQDLQPRIVSLADLVKGMAELLERSLGRTITLDVQIDDDIPAVEIDPNQLESALLNLALNARDAMEGQGPIIIAARRGHPPAINGRSFAGAFVCLSVTDRGEGMDEQTLKRATEPFFTTKGVGKGTGLGLSMVHGLAEQSGGALMLRSTPGQGTTAEIWLPAAKGQGPVPDRVSVEAHAVLPPRTSLRVLLVDDDPLVRANTSLMLDDLGHMATAVDSAQKALAILVRQTFDVLVTDHAMPHMTGAQLAAEVKTKLPDLPIILASGFAELPHGIAADLRLRKPFSQAELTDALAKVIQSASLA